MKQGAPIGNAIPRLATVTLGYSLQQDRVRLNAADIDGKTLTLWLTARLLNRLIPHLIERQFKMLNSAHNQDNLTDDDPAEFGEQAHNVQCGSGSPEILVASVDVSTYEGQLLLVFKDSEEAQRGVLVMPYNVLRQWSRGLRQCFIQAGWSQSVFLIQNAPESVGQTAMTIH